MFFSGKISNTSQQFPRQDYRRKQFETPAQEISEGPPSAVTLSHSTVDIVSFRNIKLKCSRTVE